MMKHVKNKKISKRTAIISIVIMLIAVSVLAYVTVGLVKAIKQKNSKATVSNLNVIEEQNILEDNTEISIDELANETENTNVNNTATNNNNNQTNKTSNNKSNYYIKINYGANVVTIYGKDDNNEYTVPIKAMICSTGSATPTSGAYSIQGRWRWLGLFGGVYGQYSTQIVGNILFHSVPYLRKGDPASLEYWEYDKLRNKSINGVY